MKALSIVLACLLLALTPNHAKAASIARSGAVVLTGCRMLITAKPNPDVSQAYLLGLCTGTIDGLMAAAEIAEAEADGQQFTGPGAYFKVVPFCSPQFSTLEHAVRIVIDYIDKHPERQQEDFAFLALEALQMAWPCSDPKNVDK